MGRGRVLLGNVTNTDLPRAPITKGAATPQRRGCAVATTLPSTLGSPCPESMAVDRLSHSQVSLVGVQASTVNSVAGDSTPVSHLSPLMGAVSRPEALVAVVKAGRRCLSRGACRGDATPSGHVSPLMGGVVQRDVRGQQVVCRQQSPSPPPPVSRRMQMPAMTRVAPSRQ